MREGAWQVPPPPPGLVDRRVEITGPTEPKMAINALNCGANVWLADLEDANTPHWRNVVGGQVVLKDAVRRTLSFTSPDGKEYRLREDGELPTIVPRPRGWHLPERHLLVDGKPTVGALVDAGLYLFHNARSSSTAAAARTSTCPRWRATSRRGSGRWCSTTPSRCSTSRPGRSAPRC